MRKLLLALVAVFALSLPLSAQSTGCVNMYSLTKDDITSGTASTGGSPTFARPGLFVVQVVLSGGTSMTGQVEGSFDGTNWVNMQSVVFTLTTGQNGALVFQAPYKYVRFNTLTNVGGGTVIALISW